MNRMFVGFACAVLALGAWGCSNDKSTTSPIVTDPAGSQHQTSQGDSALAAGDYTAANTHYQAALASDPTNTTARFGVAVTNVYLVQNDPDVQGIIDYLDTAPMGAPVKVYSEPSRLAHAAALLGVNQRSYSPVSEGHAVFRMLGLAVSDPPAISDVQTVIRTKIMPKLNEAEAHLAIIEQDPDFVFKVAPAVTGLADTLEIDRGDVLLLDSVLNGVQGWLGMVVAYNLDVPNNDFQNVKPESLLAANTDWAKLHTGGALDLAAAKANLLNVKIKLDAAAAEIAAETDDQANDLVPASALQTSEFQDLVSGVTKVTSTLQGAVPVDVHDYYGALFTFDLYAGRFFVPAIADLKTILPEHTFDLNGKPQLTQPLTFPDPTMNGIFPDMTNDRWRQLTGPVTTANRVR